MCNEVPEREFSQKHFDLQSRCIVYDDIATRYIGDPNCILREVIEAGFRVLDVEVVPPRDKDDLADLQLIAARE